MDKKLKIAIIGSRGYPYVYSGYETFVKELSERLVEKGHSIRVYCHKPLFIKKPKYVNGIELIYTPSIETKTLSQIVNSFCSVLHACFSDIDIILFVNSANGPFGLITKFFKVKTFINVDGMEWLRPKWSGLGSLYFLFSSWLSTIFFDCVITDSVEMKKIYKIKFNSNSQVIAYGPSLNRNKSSNIISKLNLKINQYFLVVGRLIPDNNSDLIIKSFIKTKSNKQLVIVGDVTYNDKYATQIKNINDPRLIFTGYVKDKSDLSALYKNCYCYIHGHEFGGTNPTMINAMSINCKIIALNTVFTKEMLSNYNCLFFEKNQESLMLSIEIIEKEPAKNDYSLEKRFNWDVIASDYLKLFNSQFN